jgi:transcriptional regulator with XRE-family HTH domain
VTSANSGPLIPRRRLGAAFRELREARGETLQQTAKVLMFSPSKLSRIENGLAGEPHPRDVRDLIAHFGLDGGPQAARMEELAEAGRQPGWWQVPTYRMPSDLDTFISYESAAARIVAYEPTAVPGLMQTPDYARAVIHRLVPHLTPEEIGHQVEIRLRRQEELRRRSPRPRQHYTFPETILHRLVGSVSIMRQQLAALVDHFDDPLVELHVIPFSAGIYEAAELSTVTLFEFEQDRDGDVVASERARYTQFMDRPDTVAKYRGILSRLSYYWLDRFESRAFIERLLTHQEKQ